MKPNAFLAFSIAAAFCSTAAIVALAAAGVMPGHDDKKKLIGLQNRFTHLFEEQMKKPDAGSFHWTRGVRDVAYERVQLPPAPQVSTSTWPGGGSAPAPQRVPATEELKNAVNDWFEKALSGALP